MRTVVALTTALSFAVVTSPAHAANTPSKVTVCHARAGGQLPDKRCTPGAVDPTVNEFNIGTTICVPGYTKTVRPSASYTNKLKIVQIKQYRYVDTNPADYEEDHLISLELGGDPTDPHNLWPQRGAGPNPKDRIENRLHRDVCAGRISLNEAQTAIATDWRTA